MSARRRRFPRAARARCAEHELARLLRRELALLLQEAALLRARLAPFGLFMPGLAPRGTLAAWRGEARALLARLAAQGAGLDAALLAELAGRPARRWPRASRLAAAARAALPGAERSLVLAQVLFAEGDARGARLLFVELCIADPEEDVLWRACAGLAATHECEGNDLLALGALERAARCDGCGPEALVDGLFLALAVSDLARARRAGERLDRLLAADAAGLDGGLARLAARVVLLRGAARLSGAALDLARGLARGGAPSARVARLALGGEP